LQAERLEERLAMASDALLAFDWSTPGAAPATEVAVANSLSTLNQDVAPVVLQASAATSLRQLVVIDAAVADREPLVADLQSQHVDYVVLSGDQDGIQQISRALAERDAVDALHIVSHGADGRIRLGDRWLDADALTTRGAEIAAWGRRLAGDRDVLFYGCNLAAGSEGRAFLNAFHDLTGADVAASNDVTGAAARGGNWTFEFHAGTVEAPSVFSAATEQAWSGTLPDTFQQTDNVTLRQQLQSGGLKLETITAYNFVVDSNVETPATYGPRAAHLGVRLTNTGATTLNNISVNIGDMTSLPGTGVAGVYPNTVAPAGYFGGYSGTFHLTHEGGTGDATRFLPSLAPGETSVQYWLVSYPVTDAGNNTVAGSAPVTTDDLKLYYDVWAQASEGAATRQVYDERRVTLRNEISAMANKIWPNTTSKVPDAYLQAIEDQLGWRPNVDSPRVPGAAVSEGIWYDLGNVGAGFDNDGDGIPNSNAWMQPVGDPTLYDSTAARLVKSYGLVIVKLNDGTEKLIPFEDELYFSHIPANNRGAVGLVWYEFLPLTRGGSAALSPYQEVASGYDNEKFNGDYGAGVGVITTGVDITAAKVGSTSVSKGGVATFAISATNPPTSTQPYAAPQNGFHVVFTDAIPANTTYVAGSASAANVLPTGTTATVRYSTDGGATWSNSEPAVATTVTNLAWWLSSSLAPGATATVSFQATVAANYPGTVLPNTGGVGLGGGTPANKATSTTLINGTHTLRGLVYRDDGSGTDAIAGDGVRAGNEGVGATGSIGNIDVVLYSDLNGNGVIDSADIARSPLAISALADGTFAFTNLP
ncbi:MAG TPA: DUF4347 domain-containing protein, partial [Pirellulaceae bacterium]|nr:DUF4347 domain-containing protein [Pirellulaceae bacterium]